MPLVLRRRLEESIVVSDRAVARHKEEIAALRRHHAHELGEVTARVDAIVRAHTMVDLQWAPDREVCRVMTTFTRSLVEAGLLVNGRWSIEIVADAIAREVHANIRSRFTDDMRALA